MTRTDSYIDVPVNILALLIDGIHYYVLNQNLGSDKDSIGKYFIAQTVFGYLTCSRVGVGECLCGCVTPQLVNI